MGESGRHGVPYFPIKSSTQKNLSRNQRRLSAACPKEKTVTTHLCTSALTVPLKGTHKPFKRWVDALPDQEKATKNESKTSRSRPLYSSTVQPDRSGRSDRPIVKWARLDTQKSYRFIAMVAEEDRVPEIVTRDPVGFDPRRITGRSLATPQR